MNRSTLAAALAAALSLSSGPVSAQTPAAASAGQPEDVVHLNIFKVSAEQDTGYGVSTSTSATRLATPLKDISQTVNVVTDQFLKDTFSFSTADALRYVPNVSRRNTTHLPNQIMVRGFLVETLFQDGFRTFEGGNEDLANIARIEIIKGPASAVTGRGEVGGAVNFVTKRPQKTAQHSIDLTAGSDSFYRAVLDSTGPLNAAGTVRYRVITAFQDNDGWKPVDHTQRLALYPSFEWDISPKSQLSYSGSFSKVKAPGLSSVVWISSRVAGNPPGLPEGPTARDAFLGESWERRDIDIASHLVAFTHQFNDTFSFRQGIQYGEATRMIAWPNTSPGITLNAAGDILIGRNYTGQTDHWNQYLLQGEFVAQYALLGGEHTTLVGYEYGNRTTDSIVLSGGLTPFNYTRRIYGAQPTNVAVNSASLTKAENFGVPVQHMASFFKGLVKVMAGVRFDEAYSFQDFTNDSRPDPLNSWGAYTASPRYGLTISPKDWISFYAVQSEDKQSPITYPRYNQLKAGDPRALETMTAARDGELKEYGVKAELLAGRVSVTAAWFEMKRVNQRINISRVDTDGSSYNEFIFTAGEEVKGFEGQVFGRLLDRLDLIASYARSKTSNEVQGGIFRIPSVPAYEVSAFLNYSFHDAGKDGFSLRGGYVKIGEMWGSPDNIMHFDPQDRVDAGLSYVRGRYKFDLQVNNVFDDRFITAAPVTVVLSESAPRQIFVSAGYRF